MACTLWHQHGRLVFVWRSESKLVCILLSGMCIYLFMRVGSFRPFQIFGIKYILYSLYHYVLLCTAPFVHIFSKWISFTMEYFPISLYHIRHHRFFEPNKCQALSINILLLLSIFPFLVWQKIKSGFFYFKSTYPPRY